MLIETDGLDILSWCPTLEEEALKQAKNLANLPHAFSHIALMPDCHMGYGMPIGGVLATQASVIPNAVGVDIGCGMHAVKTDLTELAVDQLKDIMGLIRQRIPVGMNRHAEPCHDIHMPKPTLLCGVIEREWNNAKTSLGTLGGGNHFIEIQKGSDGHIWVMIHSGSRNLGKQVAEYYNALAEIQNPSTTELAWLTAGTQAFGNYLADMQYCVEYAKVNREVMMREVLKSIQEVVPDLGVYEASFDVPHNYVALEEHFGESVWVHRKGATRAFKDEIGIIPGSQGSKSYIVRGLGNELSFMSCSHGAGRKMGRRAAQRNLNLDEEIQKLDSLGVVHGIRNAKDLDEAPGAYKDIEEVMQNQKDLVDVVVELSPIAVIKA